MSRLMIPNTTQIPNVILDHWMPYLSDAQLRVVLYIARRTYGFGKDADSISLKQMSEGIKKKDGTVLDHGTGLSKAGVVKACNQLSSEKYQVLIREKRSDDRGGDSVTMYRLNLDRKPPQENKANKKRIKEGGVHDVDTGGGCLQGRQGGVHDVDTQNQVVQNQEKDSSNEESKEDLSSSTPKKRIVIKKLTDDEAESKWSELCDSDTNGQSLQRMAQLLAEENKNGKVAITRVWNALGERYLRRKSKADISDVAWEFGFERALSKFAPDIGYVESCAKNYRAETRTLRVEPIHPNSEQALEAKNKPNARWWYPIAYPDIDESEIDEVFEHHQTHSEICETLDEMKRELWLREQCITAN